jgi:hypothetical protein
MICDECGQDKPDVMLRADVKLGTNNMPKLCTECCSTKPGREWMRGQK